MAVLLSIGLAGLWAWSQSEPDRARSTALAAVPEAGVTSQRSVQIAAYPRPAPGLNLLAREASPYLQLHAHNPVDWYPWGDAAFERARAEGKPIFLSVGYSTCFWCHVMEREVFSNSEIAAQMNAHFVSIKVDREERPDIDDIYMLATQLLTGSGGWPNSVFLTPDARPFFAGTYFPPADQAGRPGFPRVLAGIHDNWLRERQQVEGVADRVAERIGQLADAGEGAKPGAPVSADAALQAALAALAASYEVEHGGFSARIKFPRAPALELLLTALERARDPQQLAMLTHTLDEMALGGIYDQLAGGFHRYATEPSWSIPHFEKMLYDNAQLVAVYARAHALTGRALYRRVAEQTIAYLDREMSGLEGGFASAQDAEVAGDEGASSLWSREEIESLLGAERAARFFSVYELAPTLEHPAVGVLRVRVPVEPALERAGASDVAALLARFDADRAALLAARNKRPQPRRDDKVLVAWNALTIRALVRAADSFEKPAYLERAGRAARLLLGRLRAEDGSLHRSYVAGQRREAGVLDDYAFLADALLDLHRATGDRQWLADARALADVMLDRFADPRRGGFYRTPEGSRLLVRPKPFDDNDVPSGNAVAMRALERLASATGESRYGEAAAGVARAAAPLLRKAPSTLAALVEALLEAPPRATQRPAALASTADARQPVGRAEHRLPRSEDHVRAVLARSAGDPRRLVVRVAIDAGWHVNANPASLPFLVATEVELSGDGRPAEIDYPPGAELRPEFVPDAIRVYEGSIEIPVRVHAAPPPPDSVSLRFQACDEKLCLPPGRVALDEALP